MSERKNEKLNELFFDYICYLIFMSKQIMSHRGPYGHFALLKALEKILDLQNESNEITNTKLFDQIRTEFKTVEGVNSGDLETWIPFMDKLISLTTKTMKDM